MANKTDFTLSKDAYATFDATSLKDLIRQRLNENSTFTGQNFEGSNMSSLIDIISYSYHVLIFYLNQTSSEATFTEAELYENINRIVKTLDYKPVGTQSCNLAFEAVSTEFLSQGSYTIPRYTYIDAGGVPYTFIKDVSFNKLTTAQESLTDLSESNLLYQGKYEEFPLITANGTDFELLTLSPGEDVNIDHFSIDVYVQDVISGTWSKWSQTDSLFLESTNSKSYEIRYNENRRYELKFGNDRTGKKLNTGDVVAIYYLKNDGKNGSIGPSGINQSSPTLFNTVQFRDIFEQVKDTNITYTSQQNLNNIELSNSSSSTEFFVGETVDDIRERAPKVFSSQHRLVTTTDFESYIEQIYSNFVSDVKVVSNTEYTNGHLNYLINTLELNSPRDIESRTILNQANFADACDFNNVYVYTIPRLKRDASTIIRTNYLSVAQKNAIIDGVRDKKMITTEPLMMDPVYMAVTPGTFNSSLETPNLDIIENTIFEITRQQNSSRSLSSIKNAVNGIINKFFNNVKLNDTISLTSMVNDIINLDGVQSIDTVRTDTGQRTEGMNLLVWNPIYPALDISIISADLTLPYFKFPYLYDSTNFLNKLEVIKG